MPTPRWTGKRSPAIWWRNGLRCRWRAAVQSALLGLTLLAGQAGCTARPDRDNKVVPPLGDAVFNAADCEDGPRAAGAPRQDPPAADMHGQSEEVPADLVKPDGTPMGFALQPRLTLGASPPTGWRAVMPWGQVDVSTRGSRATNTRVEVRNLRLFVRPARTGRWCLLQYADAPVGAWVPRAGARPADEAHTDERLEFDGGRSFRIKPGMVIRIMANHRAALPDGGITAAYADFEARKVLDNPGGGDDRDTAALVASAAVGYARDIRVPPGRADDPTGEAGIGRFRRVGKDWALYSMTTAAPGVARRPG